MFQQPNQLLETFHSFPYLKSFSKLLLPFYLFFENIIYTLWPYALIPIKHNSERVPGKNYRDFNGKPLFYWIINTLLNSTYIDKIIIDTDSPTIKELVPKHFSDTMDRIIIYDRPKHLHGGHIATNDLFVNVIQDLSLDADYYFQTHTTNPLLKTSSVNDAIETFLSKINDGYETLFSVKTHHTRFYNSNGEDMNHNRFHLIPTQDLEG